MNHARSAPAPTSEASVAPTRERSIAPTREPGIAPTSGVSIALTQERSIAPTSGASVKFDSNRAWEHLRRQVAFGPRPAGTPALKQCRDYILAELKAAGIDAKPQAFVGHTPAGEIMMANVIATIPGRRSDRIILASHFDTKRAPFRFVGASDGASSTAVLLELGRVLKARQNELTIELLFLDGEEAVNWDWQDPDNRYGSRHYVQTAQQAGSLNSVKAFVLLDMVGDRNLTIKRDATSTPWLVDIIWNAAGRIGHRDAFPNALTAIEDDHVPFLRAGVPSVDIIDGPDDYPQWHTAQDDLDHVNARSLQIVGDVVLASLPDIEARVTSPAKR
jgi:glutaminyl-peptide cyclotransferase